VKGESCPVLCRMFQEIENKEDARHRVQNNVGTFFFQWLYEKKVGFNILLGGVFISSMT
jgi:hypothetical protein